MGVRGSSLRDIPRPGGRDLMGEDSRTKDGSEEEQKKKDKEQSPLHHQFTISISTDCDKVTPPGVGRNAPPEVGGSAPPRVG